MEHDSSNSNNSNNLQPEPKKKGKELKTKNIEMVRVRAEQYDMDSNNRVKSIKFRIQEVHKNLRINQFVCGELNGATRSTKRLDDTFIYCPIGASEGYKMIHVQYTDSVNRVELSYE